MHNNIIKSSKSPLSSFRAALAYSAGVISLYALARLLFFYKNAQAFGEFSPSEVGASFLIALRFDLATCAMVCGPFFLLLALPVGKVARQVLMFLLSVSAGVSVLANIFDIEYFQFSGKRLTWQSLAISQDLGDQFFSLVIYYWHLSLLSALMFASLWWLARKLFLFSTPFGLKKALTEFFTLLLLLAFCVRGGIQEKPLNLPHVYNHISANLAPLALNSAFTILKTHNNRPLPAWDFFSSRTDYLDKLASPPSANKRAKQANKPNIVIFILESFNSDFTSLQGTHSYTPFLDQLMNQGHSFFNHFANGRRSIDALPSILAGVPTLLKDPLITSSFQSQLPSGIGSKLREQGYQTHFFHGGKDGTMFFDVMTTRFGIENYHGAKAYTQQHNTELSTWGVFDEPFLQHAARILNDNSQPFFATIFTLSSHHPYEIPGHLSEKFPKGELPIHETIGYTDYALEQFFITARKQPWFDNTIFILTADHTVTSNLGFKNSTIEKFRIPLVFYSPGIELNLKPQNTLCDHVDISATVLDFAGISSKGHPRFGTSLRQKFTHEPNLALFRAGHAVIMLTETAGYVLNNHDLSLMTFDWRQDPNLTYKKSPPEDLEMATKLKSYLNYFKDGMQNRVNW